MFCSTSVFPFQTFRAGAVLRRKEVHALQGDGLGVQLVPKLQQTLLVFEFIKPKPKIFLEILGGSLGISST
jgi:hypothetical protein